MTDFYEIGPREDYSGFQCIRVDGHIEDSRVPVLYRARECLVGEYKGTPLPARAPRIGDFHMSAHGYFVRDSALELMKREARNNVITSVSKLGHDATYTQIWIVNYVDCLDVERSDIAPKMGKNREYVGVIRSAVFDEDRWDGSNLFVVPQDPSFTLYCTDDFITEWKALGLRGAMYSRHFMDFDPILC